MRLFRGKTKVWEYALEFVLVVVGITLSFYIEDQRGAAEERKLEKEYLTGLREDLANDTLFLAKIYLQQQRRTQACQDMLALAPTAHRPPPTCNSC